MCLISLYFANGAGVNVGLITTIWVLSIIFTSLADYWMYGEKLKYHHYIGLISIFFCGLFIGMQGMVNDAHALKDPSLKTKFPIWIAILFGVLTPISYCAIAMVSKYLTSPKVGFDEVTISFSTYFITNFIILIGGIPYW